MPSMLDERTPLTVPSLKRGSASFVGNYNHNYRHLYLDVGVQRQQTPSQGMRIVIYYSLLRRRQLKREES